MTGPVPTLGDDWAAAFAKPSKLWRSAPNWKPHEWTLLNVALGRIKDSVGSFDIAAFDLHQHFVTGQMKSALRHLYGTKESRILLRPEFWQPVKIRHGHMPGHARVEGDIEGLGLGEGHHIDGLPPLAGGTWIYFVRTADLDKHYPVAPAARQPNLVQPPQPPDLAQSPQQPDLVQPPLWRSDEPPLRRRGPATRHDWFLICGEIARRCIDPKTGGVQVPQKESALADEILQWLENQDLAQTAKSDMREAVKCVCAALRNVQK
jgi:hypothetical protein